MVRPSSQVAIIAGLMIALISRRSITLKVSEVAEPGRASVFSIMDGLSPRERAIVAALMQGKRTATIAREMFISESTVRSHLSSIFQAFSVRSQADLVTLLRSPRNDR